MPLLFVQEITQSVIDAALKANPYNAAAYGLLVLVLMSVAIMNYRDRRRSDKALIEYMHGSIALFTRVEDKMGVLKEIRSLLQEHNSSSH